MFAHASEASEVALASKQSSIHVDGQLTLKTRWTVPAPISGVLDKLAIEEGSHVVTGQLIAAWESGVLPQELDVAVAAYKAAVVEADQRNDKELAKLTAQVRSTELERSKQANKQFAKSVSDLEIQKQQLQVDQAKLTTAQYELRQAILDEKVNEKAAAVALIEKRIEKTSLVSRSSGQVIEILCQEGDWIAEGTPVATIVDLRMLRFEALVDWSVASKLQSGMEIQLLVNDELLPRKQRADKTTDGETKAAFRGTLKFVSPELNPVTNQVRIIAEIENAEQLLKPGMSGTLSVSP